MTENIPLGAEPIFVEWLRQEGGVRAVAWTDKVGNPYLGIFVLNRMGKPNGLPCWFRRQRFLSEVVIGFEKEQPITIAIDAEIMTKGISLSIRLPYDPRLIHRPYRRLFACWGSGAPRLGFIVAPSNEEADQEIASQFS